MAKDTEIKAGEGTITAEQIAVRVTEFWRSVDVQGDDECWEWTGYAEDGYGQFFWLGKMTGAHELAVTFTTGERRAPGLDTCHRCHNPGCCNPSHLRFDTRAGNVADMVNAGRSRRGRFTPQEVEMIRIRYEHGARQHTLADDYHVTNGLISQIVRGERYATDPGPIAENRRYNRGE